jgi:hypothetical protein
MQTYILFKEYIESHNENMNIFSLNKHFCLKLKLEIHFPLVNSFVLNLVFFLIFYKGK